MKNITIRLLSALMLVTVFSCTDDLAEFNVRPDAIDPATASPTLLLATVLAPSAQRYLNMGFGDMAGAVQHTQKNGWFSGHNQYDWDARDWTGWYDILRNNALLEKRATETGFTFFEAAALTMKSFVYGNIADLWGDAPYAQALKGDEPEFRRPAFDTQETIYRGILADLERAATLFATGSTEGLTSSSDIYFDGDTEAWQRFANSLRMRYLMRLSDKMPSEAKAGIEAIYNGGIYIQDPDQDVVLDYTGGSNDVWPGHNHDDATFTRWQACQTMVDQMLDTDDPRISVFFAPVNVQWVADESLATATEENIRADGELLDVQGFEYEEYLEMQHVKFTRRYNPGMVSFDDREYVGLTPGLIVPTEYNGNPSPGQGQQNQHVSQLAPVYGTQGSSGDILKARLISASEVSFILAEAALKGWSVGSAEEHYNNGVRNSLETWGKAGDYDTFIANVSYDGTLEQIIMQKWVASWTAATEAWCDYKRTGIPALEVGPACPQDVPAVRFAYGSDELLNNTENTASAVGNLEMTSFSSQADSPWSKSWLLQGTGKPW